MQATRVNFRGGSVRVQVPVDARTMFIRRSSIDATAEIGYFKPPTDGRDKCHKAPADALTLVNGEMSVLGTYYWCEIYSQTYSSGSVVAPLVYASSAPHMICGNCPRMVGGCDTIVMVMRD